MSRTKARKRADARVAGRRPWATAPGSPTGPRTLVDEHPTAYKDIDQVMADQADLVAVRHTLRQVLNYKG